MKVVHPDSSRSLRCVAKRSPTTVTIEFQRFPTKPPGGCSSTCPKFEGAHPFFTNFETCRSNGSPRSRIRTCGSKRKRHPQPPAKSSSRALINLRACDYISKRTFMYTAMLYANASCILQYLAGHKLAVRPNVREGVCLDCRVALSRAKQHSGRSVCLRRKAKRDVDSSQQNCP